MAMKQTRKRRGLGESKTPRSTNIDLALASQKVGRDFEIAHRAIDSPQFPEVFASDPVFKSNIIALPVEINNAYKFLAKEAGVTLKVYLENILVNNAKRTSPVEIIEKPLTRKDHIVALLRMVKLDATELEEMFDELI